MGDYVLVDITRLRSGIDLEVPIYLEKSFSKEELEGTGILALNEVVVTGTVTKDRDDYTLNCMVTGNAILPCALTLKPVTHSFSFSINGNVLEMLEEIGKIDKKMENTIDIFPIIWENILVEIPSRVVSEDTENLVVKGDGWCLRTEEQIEKINPELQKLRDLLK